ncbi:immunity protein YezG family protein [Cohnella suwonensis]|uniref:Immunity protein YezG family protein n=1 Tax=Cohnella suwonensis TaxID=696072 RepID=A0ABW0LX27_9BACL
MENQLAGLYQEIAQKINSMIPTSWDEFYYLGEVEEGKSSWSSTFYFVESNTNTIVDGNDIPTKYNVSQQIYDELLSELSGLLLILYKCFEDNEQTLWEQVSLTVSSSGKFNVDFLYEVINENDGGQLQREIVWAYETFGFVPTEGSYSRRVLDKYLKEKDNNNSQ